MNQVEHLKAVVGDKLIHCNEAQRLFKVVIHGRGPFNKR